MKFYESLLIAPITALHYVQDSTLLAGGGPILHVYDVNSEKETSCAKVLPHSSIHGLKSETRRLDTDTKVCVFGCKSARVVSLVEPTKSIECLTAGREFEDCIWDVQWLEKDREGKWEDDSSLAVALGHNSVTRWQWMTDVILCHVHCEETCILYCAKFIGTSWDDLMLAAGTVFNQVALWSVGGHLAPGKRARVLHRLAGHQGVIFAIDFHQGHMQICSASDDRSIRLWQLRYHGDRERLSSGGILTHSDDVSFEELCVFYGHSARVWGAKLLTDHIVSVGEDATCIVWTYSGEVVQKFKGHKGKSIWCLAVNPSETALATGGGDSSVRLWRHLKESDELNQHCRQRTLSLPQCSSPPQQPALDEDFPRSVYLLTVDSLLIMTNSGCLWLHQLTTGQSTQLLVDARFASYSVLTPAPDGRCILLGSMTGWLKILTSPGQEFCSSVVSSESYEEQIHEDGKIYAINWLTTDPGTDCYQFLTSGPGGALTVWHLTSDLLTGGHPVVGLQRLYQFELPYAKQRWVTAALLVANSDILVCGDRGGTVHTFRFTEQNPQQSFNKIHGKAGVTDIRYHDNCVYSCGRDGQFRKYATDENGLHLLSSNKVFKGFDWISQLLFHEDDLLVMGFHVDQFLVYSVGRNQRLFCVSCGGGHRVWDFTLSPTTQAQFVFIKNKNIVVCDASFCTSQTILKPSVHGRELTDVKYLFSSTDDSSFFLATASEDTTLSILQVTRLPTENGQRHDTCRVVASMQAHISSVKALCVSSPNPSSQSQDLLLFSVGGRAQLNAWRIYFREGEDTERSGTQVCDCGKKPRGSTGMGCDSGRETEGSMGQDDPYTAKGEGKSGGENTGNMDVVTLYVGPVNGIDDNMPLRTGDNMPLRTGDNMPIRKGDNMPSKTGDNTLCALPGDRTGNNLPRCDIQIPGSSSSHTSVPDTSPKNHCEHLLCQPPGGSTALTSGATCWHKHLGGHMLLQSGRSGRRRSWRTATCDPGPETRYMSVCVVSPCDLDPCLCPLVHVLTTACSDGYVRMFRFDESDGSFRLIAQSDFHDHCVLIVKHFIITTSANHRRAYILSAGTDGRIAFWDITSVAKKCVHSEEKCSSAVVDEEFETERVYQGLKQPSMGTDVPCSHAMSVEGHLQENRNVDASDSQCNTDKRSFNTETEKDFPCDNGDADGDDKTFEEEFPSELCPVFVLDAHQSGVNAVDVKNIKGGSSCRYIVASGGDDNALHVAILSVTETNEDEAPSLAFLDTTTVPAAHSAQITGVKILNDNTVVTSSIDQRVTLWTLVTQPKLQLLLHTCHCISVSDAVGLDVFTDQNGLQHLAVCGVGLECLEII